MIPKIQISSLYGKKYNDLPSDYPKSMLKQEQLFNIPNLFEDLINRMIYLNELSSLNRMSIDLILVLSSSYEFIINNGKITDYIKK